MKLPYSYEKIRAYLATKKTDIRNQLIGLAKIPSVCSNAEEGTPFGVACRKALDEVCTLWQNNNYQVKTCYSHGYAVAFAGNSAGKHSIGLFAHADVVPPGDDWLFTAPFEPIEKEGFIIGRGVYDNKAGILMSLYAVKAIEALNIPLRSRILLFVGTDEESGMADIQAFAQNEEMPDISLVPDNGFPLCRGERGIFRWYAISDTPFSDAVISVSGGEAFNVVLGTAHVVLRRTAELEKYLSEAAAENSSLSLGIRENELCLWAHGITGHASAPGKAVHAVYLLSRLLSECHLLPESDRGVFADAMRLTEDCYGKGFDISFRDEAFGTLTCTNGIASCENGRLSLTFDCRYGISRSPEQMEKAVKEKLSSMGWTFRLHENSPGYQISEDSPFVQTLLDTYDACIGGSDSRSYLSAGGTYARYLNNAFSMCDTPRTTPFDVPKGHGSAHQPDEMISLEGILDSATILTEMILSADEQLG
ncbi:MAG: Sapep family Mn(2+)-dependent dipeptidase [Clostridia bacterium]|nr:Sapep family Mn(2+)-dependent dipeptidase [Clostridia bacterium]